MIYKLDTENAGCDEILSADSIEEATQDVLNRYELDELPSSWSITVESVLAGPEGWIDSRGTRCYVTE